MVFAIGLRLWDGLSVYQIANFVAQEIPNLYNLVMCGIVYISTEDTSDGIDYDSIQRSLYYWKPFVMIEAVLAFIVQSSFFVFGTYTWYHADSEAET